MNLNFQFETTSSVRIDRSDLNFPSVTVCNLNPVLYSQLSNTAENHSDPRWYMWEIVEGLGDSSSAKRKKVSLTEQLNISRVVFLQATHRHRSHAMCCDGAPNGTPSPVYFASCESRRGLNLCTCHNSFLRRFSSLFLDCFFVFDELPIPLRAELTNYNC